MKAVLSWIKEFVDISLSLPELAHKLTLAGLEVEGVQIVGLPMPEGRLSEYKISGLAWEADKIVTAEVLEVLPHPNADRLVLCRLNDGEQEHIVLTGAPNLYPYKGQGLLPRSLKVAYARQGARIYDGHQPGQVITTLKSATIRGVESYSMICSEKELGISDDHEGVIILDDDAPVGIPLAEYMGDAVLEINIIPNVARAASILGLAREISALTRWSLPGGPPVRQPSYEVGWQGAPAAGKAAIVIQNTELNPRFVLGLVENVTIRPSPYWMQRRLRLAGMRPINNIVDVTNYVMLEVGEPLHAFDYDVLVRRAGGQPPTIITRTAAPGERLVTLDGVERELDDFTVLVCDSAGALSIAGVMGGAESEVGESTTNVLLEGAAWNFINIRRTTTAQRMMSEASYRFSRGVHPAMAERGVRRGLELMRQLSGGVVCQGLVDNYPSRAQDPVVEVTPADARRWLGIRLEASEMADILRRLEFAVDVQGEVVRAGAPDHRLDIGEGIIGKADVMEEIARIYGYDNIPETPLASAIPPQGSDQDLLLEEHIRDLLVNLGLQEVATYRLTSPEREARRFTAETAPDPHPYVRLANPIASDRVVLRHSLLSSLLEVVERNARLRERIAIFEIAPVYLVSEEGALPDEPLHLVVALTGPRNLPGWQGADVQPMDFYDLKGILAGLLDDLHLADVRWAPADHPSYHPGKCARILVGEKQVGVMGELHPLVRQGYELPSTPLLVGELNVQALLDSIPEGYSVTSVPAYPPVLEDLAVIVDEDIEAGRVADVIRQAGGKTLVGLDLFDVYRGEQIGAGKKSLAYSLTYQAGDRTLTDQDVLQIRQRIIRRLEQELGAVLRR
jgi:phenylalanyl-tRNA synthetase beta chain